MDIRKRIAITALICVFALSVSGCVTHRILISFIGEGNPVASYTIEGDSLDVLDGRIPHPVEPWALIKHEIEEDSSGNLTARYLYETSDVDAIAHPLAPMGETGSLSASERKYWFYDVHEVIVSFPSWRALDRYGDPDSYIPDDIRELEESGMDSLLTAEGEEELERVKARAQQLWTVDRYLRQVERLVIATAGDEVDTAVVREAVSRFAPIIRAHVMSLRGDMLEQRDPRDISLEWYIELRESMILATSEATGLSYDPLASSLDSLEAEYKRWQDFQDDNVEIVIVMPESHWQSIIPDPEETLGDTLVWTIDRDMLAEHDFTIIAAGYHVALMPTILLGLFLGGGIGLIIRLRRKQL